MEFNCTFLRISYTGLLIDFSLRKKKKGVINVVPDNVRGTVILQCEFFLFFPRILGFGYTLESTLPDNSNKYPQNMFLLRKVENQPFSMLLHFLIWSYEYDGLELTSLFANVTRSRHTSTGLFLFVFCISSGALSRTVKYRNIMLSIFYTRNDIIWGLLKEFTDILCNRGGG